MREVAKQQRAKVAQRRVAARQRIRHAVQEQRSLGEVTVARQQPRELLAERREELRRHRLGVHRQAQAHGQQLVQHAVVC